MDDLVPLWSEAPRYCPHRKFPAYRFVPGLNPHPTGDPAGHSYGRDERPPPYSGPDRWRENELYLFGIDLYHQGYFWESHEAWETLWHLTNKEDAEGQFLQGLIQNSAAQLKRHVGQIDGVRHLSQEAHRRLLFVRDSGGPDERGYFMGLHVGKLLKAMEGHYGPVWKGRKNVVGQAPLLDALGVT